MKKLYYPNCSELIADFKTKDPKKLIKGFKKKKKVKKNN